ncbi:hypothetical protein [Saccharothrix yanglingensis]|uniref:DNA primase/polymerase bifunctional N-terminal domain-containing protein n=1 Tax=Saccharothrix yanglingensis TaxID=659496 RepID=A0ABU0XAY1_9PSEU|nr:hypothetical protein [Saccharothrix yanglingensis]MDQ2587794.1 hypothetical protein [Saccharothrix yanglingensis]
MERWHVEGSLVLTEGAVAVEVPASWGAEVSHQLRSAGPLGPILAIPGPRLRWLFLARPDPEPTPDHVLPPDVRYWRGPRSIPAVESRWVVPPEGALPPVGAVRCAIRTVRRSL